MDYMEEKMKKMKKLSLVLVLALMIGMFGNILPASAATKSSWSFETTSGKTIEVNEMINMKKNEFQDFNLFKSGKEITQKDSRYTVSWSSSDEDVIWINAKSGKARADKFGNLSDEYVEATVTAKITNKTTRAVAYRRFKVSVGTPEPELPEVDHITLRFKDGTDPAEALKIDQTYTLETLAYDADNKLMAEEDAALYYAYFCDKAGITISGSTFKPTKDGEYTITVGGFDSKEAAAAATSAAGAPFSASIKNLVVEANKPKITELRQIDLYTVGLTFNKPEYAKELVSNSSKLSVSYTIGGSMYTTDFQELLVDDENPSTVLITLYSGLTEGVTYTFTYKSTETLSATVTGSGTKPAQIVLESETVEVEREYFFKVKVLNDKGVDITDITPYTCTYESLDSDFAIPYILDATSLYFFEAGKTAVIRAKLDLGYDSYGNQILPLYSTARFVSIPKAQPIFGSCNGYALEAKTDAPESLTYTNTAKTICLGDDSVYLYATFPYTDEFRETHKRYIAEGRDEADLTAMYTYKSSNPNVLEVDALTGMLYPFSKGFASIYIMGENNRHLGIASINVADERALTTLTMTNQSASKLSATGSTSGDEYVTIKLNAKDQFGGKVDADYDFALTGATDIDFSNAFNSSLEGDTLKIWEGNLLDDVVTTTSPVRRFAIAVTASYNGKTLPAQTFYITVKNVTNATATTPKLMISQTNIDLKLGKDSLKDYESVIQVVSTDSNGYFIQRENIKMIHNASNADTALNAYSVLILYKNEAVTDSVLPIEISDNQLILKPLTSSGGNEIKKASLGSYSIRLYKGNGTKAQPITSAAIVLSDSTPAISVSIKDKNIANTDYTTLQSALSFKRGTTDISSHVEIVDLVPRRVNNTYQISELTLKVKAKEFNPDWPSEEDYTTVKITGLNLQFKITN